MRVIGGMAAALVALVSASSGAYQLNDHQAITEQAYREFATCFPRFSGLDLKALVQGDLDEDLNLIEKELFYSHYYNPYKKLKMFRADSSGRLDSLAPVMAQCRTDAARISADEIWQLGHVIHHLQDMTVPAHVVPVTHSFWDGYENYKFSGDISSEWSCERLGASGMDNPAAVLKETAQDTLTAIRAMVIEGVGKADHSIARLDGTALWVEAVDSGFGNYGILGNGFGKAEVNSPAGLLQIDDSTYRLFKQQQMKAAVRASLRALVWIFQPSH